MDSVNVTRVLLWWVSPFGNPRINAHLQLPVAYRSLSRPSSALDAKAFTLCPFLLELPIRFSHFRIAWVSKHGFHIFAFKKVFLFSALFSTLTCESISLTGNRSILLPSISGKTLIFLTLQSLLHLLISKSRLFSLLSVRFYTLSLFGFQRTSLSSNLYLWRWSVSFTSSP